MTDLPHTYNGDITFGETQDKIAVTEFTAQKLGQNINYLIDVYPPLVAEIDAVAAAVAKIADVNTGWGGGFADPAPIFSTPTGAAMKGALLWVPGTFGANPFGFGTIDQQGAIPIVTVTPNDAHNIFYKLGGGFFKFFITGNTCFIHASGGTGSFSITGIQFY